MGVAEPCPKWGMLHHNLPFGLKAQLTPRVRPAVGDPATCQSLDTSVLVALLQPGVAACPHSRSAKQGQL